MTDKKGVSPTATTLIELHRLQNSNHNEGLIVALPPEGRSSWKRDARLNPPAAGKRARPRRIPTTVNLAENLNRLKLDVETIIPIHYPADSRKVSITELMRESSDKANQSAGLRGFSRAPQTFEGGSIDVSARPRRREDASGRARARRLHRRRRPGLPASIAGSPAGERTTRSGGLCPARTARS